MSHPAVTLREVETLRRILDVLRSTDHCGYPVIEVRAGQMLQTPIKALRSTQSLDLEAEHVS